MAGIPCSLDGSCREVAENWSLTRGLVSLLESAVGSNKIWRLVLERTSVFWFVKDPGQLKSCEEAVGAIQQGNIESKVCPRAARRER